MDLKELKELRRECDHVIRAAEDWSPEFRKQRKLFKELTGIESSMQSNAEAYFKDLAGRVGKMVDWHGYAHELADKTVTVDAIDAARIAGAEKKYAVNISFGDNMVKEQTALTILITQDIIDAAAVGAQYGQVQVGIDLGVSNAVEWIQKAAIGSIGKQIPGITETTRNRIEQSIQTSLSTGEGINKAAERLRSVIEDPARAQTIAQTETVRAWGDGLIAYGKQAGAKSKKWNTSYEPCAACLANDLQGWIPFDEAFESGDDGTPQHPRCRCSLQVSLLAPESNPAPSAEKVAKLEKVKK